MVIKMTRDSKGRFRKRKRSNPSKRRYHAAKARRSHKSRRRSNPGLMVANPRKNYGAALASRPPAPKKPRRKRRKLAPNARGGVNWRKRSRTQRRYHAAPGKGGKVRVHRTNPGHRRRRRSNPSFTSLRSLMPILKIGISGGLGIVVARLGGGFYDKYARQMVMGDGSPLRSALSDVARIAAMAAAPILAEKYVVRHVKMLDGKAFLFGGLAEAGRNAVGVAARRFAPSLDRHTWGLDGLTTERDFSGLPASRLAAMGISGLVEEGDFSGMDGLVGEDAFGAVGGGLDSEGDATE